MRKITLHTKLPHPNSPTNRDLTLKAPLRTSTNVSMVLETVTIYFFLFFPLFSPGSRVVDHFSSRFSFHSPFSSDEDLFHHLQNLNQAFRSSQTLSHNIAIITDRGIKKSQVATVVAHIWTDNSIIQHLQVNSINITSIEAKLIAIHLGLIPAMEEENVHDIIVITDSIAAAKKIFESKTDPLQNMSIPVTSAINSFFRKDDRNKIQFWFCSSKTKWPKHKLVDDQVKANNCAPIFPSKELHLFNKKKECDNILHKWQDSFTTNPKRGQCFLDFEDKNQKVIKPTYAKGSLWLPFIDFTNSLCAYFTHMTTSHAPIGEYRQRFFPYLPISCLCGEAKIQT